MGFHVFGLRKRSSISRLFAVLSPILLGLLTACSQGSDIVLQAPAKPTPPSHPSDSSGSDSSVDTSDGRPTSPGTPVPPAPTTPSAPVETRYRMFCDDRYPPYLTAVSSMATPMSFGAGVDIGEPNARGEYDPQVDRSLEMHEHAQIINLPKFGQARVVFSARRVPRGSDYGFQRYLFIADVDISGRKGVAKELGPEIKAGHMLEVFGEDDVFSARTFGVSDQGKYLLLGQADGYRLVDSKTLKVFGVVKTGSASLNVNPTLRESDMIFTVGAFKSGATKGGVFEGKLYSLGVSGGVLKTAKLVSVTPGLRRPLVSVGPKAGEVFVGLDSVSAPGSHRIAVVSPLKTRAGFAKLSGLPKSGRLSSTIAGWREPTAGALRAVIVFEDFIPTRAVVGQTFKVEQAFVRELHVDEKTLDARAVGTDIDYPPEARAGVESGSMYRRLGVEDLVTTQDGQAVFGLFPGAASSKNIYRLTASGLERVSQTECTRLGVGVESDNGGVWP